MDLNELKGWLKAEHGKQVDITKQLARIKELSAAGEGTVEFTDLYDSTDESTYSETTLTNTQKKQLVDMGYKVSWDDYPPRWIVSGWFA